MYKVNTGNCYDSVIEMNLNTGLPPGVSYITDKQLEGKKEPTAEQLKEIERRRKNKDNQREVNLASISDENIQLRAEKLMNKYQERGLKLNARRIQAEYARYGIIQSQEEIELMFKRAVAVMNRLAARQKEELNEEKLAERQKLFNTQKDDDELKKPGHIQNARLFDSQETKQNIKRLEEKSMPGLIQQNKLEEEKAMNKRVDRRKKVTKSGTISAQTGSVSQGMSFDQLILKEKEQQAEKNTIKSWIKTDFLNQRAKNECDFLQNRLLDDIRGNQSTEQAQR